MLLAVLPSANVLARGQGGTGPIAATTAGRQPSAVVAGTRSGVTIQGDLSPASIAHWWDSFSPLPSSLDHLLRRPASAAAASSAPIPAAIVSSHTTLRPLTVTERLLSSSLSGAATHGLLVAYAVDEQVAGQFEVMIGARRARSLHISGFRAAALPRWYPAQTVIAMHLLVTMHAAKGRLRIHFLPHTRRELRRLRSLALTVRLVVRNASREAPKAMFVRREVTLRG